ncbi:MAG: hypothetical protein ACT4PO_04770 [Actinomycetota bacterium]
MRKTRVIVGSLLIGGLLALGLGTTPAAAARVRVVAACIGWDHTGPYVDPFTGEAIDSPSIVIIAVSVDGAPVGAVLRLVLVAPDGRVFDVLGEVGQDGRLSGASGIFTFGVYRASPPVKIAFIDPTTGAERTVNLKPTAIVRGGSFNVQSQEVECSAGDLPRGDVLTGEEPPPPVETESPPVETESPPIVVGREEGGLAVIWLVLLGAGGVVIVIGVFVLVSGRREGGVTGAGELVHPGGAGELVHPGGAAQEPVYPGGPPGVVVELPVEVTEEVAEPEEDVETIDTSEASTTEPETATEEEDCDELRDRCAELSIAAANAAGRATEARRRANEAKSKCDAAKKARELAERALAAAERDAERKRDDESWMESEGRRRTSEDLRLEREDAREAYEAYRRGEITPQQLEDAWRKSGDWDRLQELRKKDVERRKKRIAGAKEALEKAKELEESICKDADAQEEAAKEAEEAARQAQAEADRACKAADDCEQRQSEGAPTPFGPRLGEAPPGGPAGAPPGVPTVPPPPEIPKTPPPPETPPGPPPIVPPTAGGGIAGGPKREEPPPNVIDGRTPTDSRPCNCGPDVTDIYIDALNEILRKLRVNVGWAITWAPGSGVAFLLANGLFMDFKVENVDPCMSCPRCVNTVTLLGRCVVDHTLNDLIFGICAGYFGVPEDIQDLGGHGAELASYGSLDSPISQQIYRAGNAIGRRAYENESFRIDGAALAELMKVAPVRIDCTPCPKKATATWKNFAEYDWNWPGTGKE